MSKQLFFEDREWENYSEIQEFEITETQEDAEPISDK